MIARYHRLTGDDTHFLMGNDEHSQNVFKRAQEQGKDPLAYCDEMEQVFREVWQRAGHLLRRLHPHDRPPRHRPAVQRTGAGLSTTPATSTRATTRAGTASAARSSSRRRTWWTGSVRIHLTKPEWIKREELVLPAVEVPAAAAGALRSAPDFIEPEIRRNEILRLVEAGLEDMSISRAGQSWGIPLPFDPTSVVYVWFDALINYAAAVGYGWDDEAVRASGGRPTSTSSARTSRASTA